MTSRLPPALAGVASIGAAVYMGTEYQRYSKSRQAASAADGAEGDSAGLGGFRDYSAKSAQTYAQSALREAQLRWNTGVHGAATFLISGPTVTTAPSAAAPQSISSAPGAEAVKSVRDETQTETASTALVEDENASSKSVADAAGVHGLETESNSKEATESQSVDVTAVEPAVETSVSMHKSGTIGECVKASTEEPELSAQSESHEVSAEKIGHEEVVVEEALDVKPSEGYEQAIAAEAPASEVQDPSDE